MVPASLIYEYRSKENSEADNILSCYRKSGKRARSFMEMGTNDAPPHVLLQISFSCPLTPSARVKKGEDYEVYSFSQTFVIALDKSGPALSV